MNEADRIRKRKSYQKFAEILDSLAENDPRRAQILRKYHQTIDELRGFGSERASRFAWESIEQLCKDRGLVFGANTGVANNVSKLKLFQITSVCKEDLRWIFEGRPDALAKIDELTDDEMGLLARKMADDYCDQLFWDSARIIFEDRFLEGDAR